MRNAPAADLLLSVALETYQRDILPHLPPSARYAGLMVANAMGIAARQTAAGTTPQDNARDALAALLGVGEGVALEKIERSLCSDIRRGRFDPPADGSIASTRTQTLFAALQAITRSKAAESCPKALSVQRGQGQ
jgi:hypothetical protein